MLFFTNLIYSTHLVGPVVPLEREEVEEESPPNYSTATGEEVFETKSQSEETKVFNML